MVEIVLKIKVKTLELKVKRLKFQSFLKHSIVHSCIQKYTEGRINEFLKFVKVTQTEEQKKKYGKQINEKQEENTGSGYPWHTGIFSSTDTVEVLEG